MNIEVVALRLSHRLVIVILINHAAPLDSHDLLPQLLERFFWLPVLIDAQITNFELARLILRSDAFGSGRLAHVLLSEFRPPA